MFVEVIFGLPLILSHSRLESLDVRYFSDGNFCDFCVDLWNVWIAEAESHEDALLLQAMAGL